MSSVFLSLNIPASTGVGTNTDVHALEPSKTLVIGGTINPALGEIVVVEGSLDPGASEQSFFGICYFQGVNEPPRTISTVLQWMRVRRVSASAANSPNVELGSDNSPTETFFTLNVPATAGPGSATDVSAGGETMSFMVKGGIVQPSADGTSPGETFLIEGSNDNVNWNGVIAFTKDNQGANIFTRRYNFVRVNRSANFGSTPGAFCGTSTSSGGGGAFPGYGAAPPAIAAASAAGTATTVSRSDHTHQGALEHGSYVAPALLQSTGVLQQSYGAPTATLAAFLIGTDAVPFGAGGVLTWTGALSFIPSSSGRAELQVTPPAGLQPSLFLGSADTTHPGRIIMGDTSGTSMILTGGTVSGAFNQVGLQLAASTLPTADSFVLEGPGAIVCFQAWTGNGAQDVAVGPQTANATNATRGFLWIPTVAGAPTGVPALPGGGAGGQGSRVPFEYDTTNDRIRIYNTVSAAWKSVALA